MSADDCVFCKIATGEIPCNKIYEDEAMLAFLDIGPVSRGHTLVIPKEHFTTLHDCPVELLAKVMTCVRKIAPAVVGAVGSRAYNVLCNNGRAAGQLVEHVHFHLIPRNADDGVFNRWPAGEYEKGQADAVAVEIRSRL
jgi:histidine triad (HIT) family protein